MKCRNFRLRFPLQSTPYLADPQNFTVSIKPQMQMPVLAVFMAGAAAPKAIPQLLNLEIKANQ